MSIEASYCAKCERAVVPPRSICPYCGLMNEAMSPTSLKGEGTVLSYTRLHSPPEGFEPPLRMALIQLEHEAVVLALAGAEVNETIAIGTHVRLSTDDEGRFRYSLA